MDRSTVMKTFHGGNLISKSPINMRDRDASFSSYLKPGEKPVVTCQPHDHDHAIGYVDESTNELSIFDAHKYFNNEVNDIQKVPMSNNSRVSPVVNTETESNTAPEKGGYTIENTTRYSSVSSSVDAYAAIIRNYRGGSLHGSATPTASSEASWNSQSALLTHPNAGGARPSQAPSQVAVSHQNRKDLKKKIKASMSKPIWILRRKCPCSGRKSVQVKETTKQHKSQVQQQQQSLRHGNEIESKSMVMNPKIIHIPTIIARNNSSKSQRFHQHRVVASSSVRVPFSDGFTFPVLNANPPSLKLNLIRADENGVVSGGEEDQPPRESLEVFQPLETDCVEQTSENPRLVAGGGGGGDDDVASDASSDLFEIESFSAAAQPACSVVFRREICSSNGGSNELFSGTGGRRTSMDDVSTVTEGYVPSEASMEWSVTTAEGCYEESLAGDGGDAAALAENWRRKVVSSSTSSENGLLGGCRSEKAVSVGPQAVMRKCVGVGEEGHIGSTSTSYSG